jgi:hypothetical protein
LAYRKIAPFSYKRAREKRDGTAFTVAAPDVLYRDRVCLTTAIGRDFPKGVP